jgi:thymidine kinase
MEYEDLIILHYSVKRNFKQKMFHSDAELLEWCKQNLKNKYNF